jgi:septum site-determining protein MinC
MDLPAISQQRVKGGSAVATASPPRRPPAFDLKGTMAPLTVLRLRSADLALVERQLRVKIAQLPHLFLQAPVLLDLGALEEASPLTIIDIVTVLKMCKLIPVAATNVPIALRGAIAESGLGILQAPAPVRAKAPDGAGAGGGAAAAAATAPAQQVPPPPPARQAPAPQPAQFSGPLVVRQAVRGGQVIYAQNNDLVVLAPVNAGAQVIADGHVHIYATLRGRAVAGANGLPGARIFVQKLEAELIAISGSYVMAEEIPPQLRGRSVQAWLENGECKLAPL